MRDDHDYSVMSQYEVKKTSITLHFKLKMFCVMNSVL